MSEQSKVRRKIMRGYEKLAFGNICDAVRLLFCDEENLLELGELDLFNVAEIKKQKGGGMEIKFFDRIKALQCMELLESCSGKGPEGFYKALEEGARSFGEKDGD